MQYHVHQSNTAFKPFLPKQKAYAKVVTKTDILGFGQNKTMS